MFPSISTTGYVWLFALASPGNCSHYSQEALRLARPTEVMMTDVATCELHEAVFYLGNNRLIGPGHHWALFREARDKRPFAEGVTPEDSTITIRFEAKPGEVFYGRGFQTDKAQRKIVSAGPMYRYVCQPTGRVDVGDLEQVKQKEAVERGSGAVFDVKRPRD